MKFISFFNNKIKYSTSEISKHNDLHSLWVIINNKVYDLTSFSDIHPGGSKPFIHFAGCDATEGFKAMKHDKNKTILKLLKDFEIGIVKN